MTESSLNTDQDAQDTEPRAGPDGSESPEGGEENEGEDDDTLKSDDAVIDRLTKVVSGGRVIEKGAKKSRAAREDVSEDENSDE